MADSVDSMDQHAAISDDAELSARARRRREEADGGRLSVADLLARHGTEGGAPARRSHRLRGDDAAADDHAAEHGADHDQFDHDYRSAVGEPEAVGHDDPPRYADDRPTTEHPVVPAEVSLFAPPVSGAPFFAASHTPTGADARRPDHAAPTEIIGRVTPRATPPAPLLDTGGQAPAAPATNRAGANRVVPGTPEQGGVTDRAPDEEPPAIRGRGYLPGVTAAAGSPEGAAFTGVPQADLTGDPDPSVAPGRTARADAPGRPDARPPGRPAAQAPGRADDGGQDSTVVFESARDSPDRDDVDRDRRNPSAADRPDEARELPEPRDERADRSAPAERATPEGSDAPDEDSWAKTSVADRTVHIDQTLSRLTAIHAGLSDELLDRVSGTTRLNSVVGSAKGRGRRRAGSSSTGADHEPSSGPAGIWARWWPPTRRTKIVAVGVAAVLLLAVCVGVGGNLWLNGKLHTVEALDPAAPGVINAAAQSGDRNYLFVISDPSDGQAPESNVSTGVESVLLAHVPADQDRVVLLSAPAGLLVDRPGCQTYDAGSVSYGAGTAPAQSGVPLSSAYQVGGPKCLVAQMQLLTGLAINHYASLNLASVREMVDEVGGLSLCVAHPVVDDALGVVAANPGRQLLGGDAALSYARAWHVRGESEGAGQLSGQALRQQVVLTTLLDRIAEHPLLHLPTTVSTVGLFGANSLVDGLRLSDLGELSAALTGTDPAAVDFVGVPTAGQPDTQGNVVPSADAAKTLFDAIRSDRALPGEGATGPTPATTEAASTTALPPNQVTVTVRNGSAKSGLANTAADSLRGLGFQVAGVGDAPHQAGGRTVIRASADRADQAAALAQAVPSATVQTVPGAGTLELILGDSFDGQVSAAAAGTPAGPALLTAAQLSCH